MKKMLLALVLLVGPRIAFADLGDQITSSLIDHVSASSQWTTDGENRLARQRQLKRKVKRDPLTAAFFGEI